MFPSATADDITARLTTAHRSLDDGDLPAAMADLTRAVEWLRTLGAGTEFAQAHLSYGLLDDRLAAARTALDGGLDPRSELELALRTADSLLASLVVASGPDGSLAARL